LERNESIEFEERGQWGFTKEKEENSESKWIRHPVAGWLVGPLYKHA
jgi:hypothetical protein